MANAGQYSNGISAGVHSGEYETSWPSFEGQHRPHSPAYPGRGADRQNTRRTSGAIGGAHRVTQKPAGADRLFTRAEVLEILRKDRLTRPKVGWRHWVDRLHTAGRRSAELARKAGAVCKALWLNGGGWFLCFAMLVMVAATVWNRIVVG